MTDKIMLRSLAAAALMASIGASAFGGAIPRKTSGYNFGSRDSGRRYRHGFPAAPIPGNKLAKLARKGTLTKNGVR